MLLSGFRGRLVLCIAIAAVLLIFSYFYLLPVYHSSPGALKLSTGHTIGGEHPIDHLVQRADEEWRLLLSRKTTDLASAAREYRQRRGRHPPPGFDKWFQQAKAKNAIIIEDLFDQIYADLSPFWGIDPRSLRHQAKSFQTRVVVRNGVASMRTDEDRVWMTSWHSLVQSLQQYLPDLDMPINTMDESRLITPWERIAEYVQADHANRGLTDVNDVVRQYMNLTVVDEALSASQDGAPPPFIPAFLGPGAGSFWDMTKVGCGPESPARLHPDIGPINYSHPPPEIDHYLANSYHGYVSNWTASKDPCQRPELQFMHGTFIEPISVATAHELLPLFGGSKIPVNNDILLPAAMYWYEDERYSGGSSNHGGPWDKKRDRVVWHGAATGGRNKEENWTGFQRQRFLAMINATIVEQAQRSNTSSWLNFQLPDPEAYPRALASPSALVDFLREYVDASFMDLVCFPFNAPDPPHCPYTQDYFEIRESVPMKEQYSFKYLPDLDGNSFSGRYRGFLLSTSLPIKATIYNEWHDSRLIPWAHFVPMDSTYKDIYGILDYFLGVDGNKGRDDIARKIALDGKSWAEHVLRKEDMQIYTHRLLLEYARLCDDRREKLAFVDDLVLAGDGQQKPKGVKASSRLYM